MTVAEDGQTPAVQTTQERRKPPRWLALVVLVALLAASAGVAAWLYFTDYEADQQVDTTARQAVLTAATDGAVAILSYTPETLDADFTNAKSRLTGDFLNYYTDFTTRIVTPAAKDKEVRTSAAVVRKAIMRIEPDSAEVLIFLNQNTTSRENPDGAFSASAVKVRLEKHDDTWLIAAFDPQ